jgi:hypothetical protein
VSATVADTPRRPASPGRPARPRLSLAALCALGFAIIGFVYGLTVTAGGGDVIDLVYHATMLPILIGTAVLLVRYGRLARPHGRSE